MRSDSFLSIARNFVFFFLIGIGQFTVDSGYAQSQEFELSLPVGQKNHPVKIQVIRYYQMVPPIGFEPFRVTITNGLNSEHRWTFRFTSMNNQYRSEKTFESVFNFSVPGKSQKQFEVFVPVINRSRQPQISLFVQGAGVRYPSTDFIRHYAYYKNNYPFVVLGEKFDEKKWEDLLGKRGGSSSVLDGSVISIKDFPPDWKSLSGVGILFLKEEEWKQLNRLSQEMILDWVLTGGKFEVLLEASQTNLKELGLPFLDQEKKVLPERVSKNKKNNTIPLISKTRHGLGYITLRHFSGSEEETKKAIENIVRNSGISFQRQLSQKSNYWSYFQKYKEIGVNLFLLLGFICVFGVLIGPINLFVLSPSSKRHRILWLTPAISIGASLILVVLILFQDGFGGRGGRSTAYYIDAPQQKGVFFQEQVCKTGLLLGTGFKMEPSIFISDIESVSSLKSLNRIYQREGNAYGGDWFTSRQVQGLILQDLRPMRNGVELVDEQESVNPNQKVVMSTLPSVLSVLYYLDEKGKVWKGENLNAGQKQILYSSTMKEFKRWWNEVLSNSGPRTKVLFKDLAGRQNHFFAASKTNETGFIETLPSITWEKQMTIYSGVIEKRK